jgi:hypothetical protein
MSKLIIKTVLISIVALFPFSFFAQNSGGKNSASDDEDYLINRDSVWGFEFDFSELDPANVKLDILTKKLAKLKRYNDSLMTLIKKKNIKERSDSLEQLYHLMVADTSSGYNAYTFFAGQFHSNVTGLNKSLAALGWPKLNAMSFEYTNLFDFTWKRGRIIQDVFISQGAGRAVTKNEVEVSYKYKSLLNYNFGYAIIDSKRIQFYPFAGLSYQTSQLNFTNLSVQAFELGNGSFDSLIVAAKRNKDGVNYQFKKRELILNYGLELDVHVFYSKRKTGFILGVRSGGALPLIGGGWKLDGVKYSQYNSFIVRDYYFDIVLRIYTRLGDRKGKYYLKNVWWE